MKGRKKGIVFLIILFLIETSIFSNICIAQLKNESNTKFKNQSSKPLIVYINKSWMNENDVKEYNVRHGSNLVWEFDAFNNIVDGVSHVRENGSVIILSGRYQIGKTTIHITKPLNLIETTSEYPHPSTIHWYLSSPIRLRGFVI
jgi:hypothetical protein